MFSSQSPIQWAVPDCPHRVRSSCGLSGPAIRRSVVLRIQSDPGQPSQPLPGSAELLMEGRQLLCEPSQLLAPHSVVCEL